MVNHLMNLLIAFQKYLLKHTKILRIFNTYFFLKSEGNNDLLNVLYALHNTIKKSRNCSKTDVIAHIKEYFNVGSAEDVMKMVLWLGHVNFFGYYSITEVLEMMNSENKLNEFTYFCKMPMQNCPKGTVDFVVLLSPENAKKAKSMGGSLEWDGNTLVAYGFLATKMDNPLGMYQFMGNCDLICNFPSIYNNICKNGFIHYLKETH